jgi:YggT family protein
MAAHFAILQNFVNGFSREHSSIMKLCVLLLAVLALLAHAAAFVPAPASFSVLQRSTQLQKCAIEHSTARRQALTQTMQSARAVSAAAIGLAVVSAAAPALAAVPEWIAPTRLVLDPALIYLEFAFVCRIVLSWYPKIDLNKTPQNLVAWPTEPLLKPTRAVVPPAFGVDVSPIVWVMIMSFLREVLLGQQGVLTLLAQKG